MIIFQIILFVLVLSFLVIIHELGHYLVAKWQKVRVEEFGVGYPPRALKLFKKGETLFSLNWIPFGGFVKLEGEEGPDSEKDEDGEVKPDAHGYLPFYAKGKLSRLAIILAGATVNFVFGIIAFSVYFSVKGIPELLPDPRIAAVAAESPIAKAGVPANVNITGFEFAGQTYKTTSIDDVTTFVGQHLGEQVTVMTTGICKDTTCDQTTHQYPLRIRTKEETPAGQGSLGVAFDQVVSYKFYPWYQMPFRGTKFGLEQALLLSELIITSLGGIFVGLFKGQVPQEVAGPFGIFSQARQAGFFSGDPFELLNLAGKLSVNLAIMNVLPIPALDGGRGFFILIEKFVGRKRLNKVEGYINYAAFGLLLLLTLLITFKDILGLVPKK
ncbi:RIP metalloprotease RseP [soil metagenome]